MWLACEHFVGAVRNDAANLKQIDFLHLGRSPDGMRSRGWLCWCSDGSPAQGISTRSLNGVTIPTTHTHLPNSCNMSRHIPLDGSGHLTRGACHLELQSSDPSSISVPRTAFEAAAQIQRTPPTLFNSGTPRPSAPVTHHETTITTIPPPLIENTKKKNSCCGVNFIHRAIN